ncbi:MAG: hypothetical protein ABSC94_30795 [Polyangiaceae bacterium]|jgi:hypothetical protein
MDSALPNESGTSEPGPSDDAAASDEADDDAGSSERAFSEAGAGDGGPYTGVIYASVPGYRVGAGFSVSAGSIEFSHPETTADTGCSCIHGIGDPGQEEASAGTITIRAADGGPVLASLMVADSFDDERFAELAALDDLRRRRGRVPRHRAIVSSCGKRSRRRGALRRLRAE